ncbi:DUF393 domain-containing protein [Flavisolibacter sp. BT320]|nr:DUF393 domain-containing protein [Flavisolibacter longurius]
MKKLIEHVILYDAACPMCDLYTKGFQTAGMLDENGRLPYQDMPANLACSVNMERSVNEIALVNSTTGKVYYGVESLLQIIVHSLPVLKPLAKNKAFLFLVDKLYKAVSFNRRVILPAVKKEMQNPAFAPSFNARYRAVYIVFALVVSAFVLHRYSFFLNAILPASSFGREALICTGQLVWQGAMVFFLDRKKSWDYLGNLMTVSLAGSLLLGVVMAIGGVFGIQDGFFYLALFGLTVSLMLLEHMRRVRLLEVNGMLSATWVLYRILVLIILYMLGYAG